MIRRVFSLDRGMMEECFYIVNQFMDASSRLPLIELKMRVDSGESVLLVDEKENGYLRGFLIGKILTGVATVDNLFVDKTFHCTGIGGALLKAYEDYARRCGARQIKLQSRPTKQALDFYKKHGYVKINWENYMQKSL